MTKTVPARDRQITVTRRVEAALTVAFMVLTLLLTRQSKTPDSLIAAFLALMVLTTIPLNLWQYRVMDEFRRARMLKSWALGGYAGFISVTGLIGWHAFTADSNSDMKVGLLELYLPWIAILVTQLATTAWLYWRDTRSA